MQGFSFEQKFSCPIVKCIDVMAVLVSVVVVVVFVGVGSIPSGSLTTSFVVILVVGSVKSIASGIATAMHMATKSKIFIDFLDMPITIIISKSSTYIIVTTI